MYYYIYDSFVGERKFRRRVAAIENSLTDLGISGERERVTPIRPVPDLVKAGIERGVSTIVIVGNDYTFTKAINAAAVFGLDPDKVIFGIIPLGEPNKISSLLGITDVTTAPQELAARKTDALDIGQINKRFFITSVTVGFEPEHKTRKDVVQEKISPLMASRRIKKFKPQPVKIWLDGGYRLGCELFNLSILNIADKKRNQDLGQTRAESLVVCLVPYTKEISGQARLVASRKYAQLPNASIFRAQHIRVDGPKTMKVATDGVLYDHPPLEIGIIPQTLKVIVGKNRKF
jgi:diacylglycerol kinase family enzyme